MMMGKPANSITRDEIHAAVAAMDGPLSGYLAGQRRGGRCVQALEAAFSETFRVKHSIAVNSATSGLLAAAFAIRLKNGDKFAVSAMTMTATAAAPMFTGAAPSFCDVSDDDFSIDRLPYPGLKAIFATSLFGHPAKLYYLRKHAEAREIYLIEDNAQSPFAMEGDRYAGTIGHIGVWSFNIHKPLQCGEGGMVTTDDDELAERVRAFINHGENLPGATAIGLNLRMPEVSAAIALSQLRRGPELIDRRVDQAEMILGAIGEIPGLRPPPRREDCTHVYYAIPFLIEQRRAEFCNMLWDMGVPVVVGYVDPLYRLPAFAGFGRKCAVAEELHDHRLFYIENCAWDFTKDEIGRIGDAFKRAAEAMGGGDAKTARGVGP
jgi:dTDP-4-amino-4,6-dideoxygalactose transaminase